MTDKTEKKTKTKVKKPPAQKKKVVKPTKKKKIIKKTGAKKPTKKKLPPKVKAKHNGPYKKVIDFATLSKLCAMHCTGEECASILAMDYDTLNRRLKEEGHKGFTDYYRLNSAKGKMSLRQMQLKIALSGNVAMLMFLGKQYLGQAEKVEQAVTSKTFSPENKEVLEQFLLENGIDPTKL